MMGKEEKRISRQTSSKSASRGPCRRGCCLAEVLSCDVFVYDKFSSVGWTHNLKNHTLG